MATGDVNEAHTLAGKIFMAGDDADASAKVGQKLARARDGVLSTRRKRVAQ
jgi:hypothetical protein